MDETPPVEAAAPETKEKVSIFKQLFSCGILKKKSKAIEPPVEDVTPAEEPVVEETPVASPEEVPPPTEESPPAEDEKPEQPREEEEVKKEEDKSLDPASKKTEVVDLSNKFWCGCF